ncbi:unnamed protein product, partial [Medioppia subpectinata]
PYLWWKRYITRLQLIQFAILIVYGILCFTIWDLSQIPEGLQWFGIVQPFIFFYMFFMFYLKSYKIISVDYWLDETHEQIKGYYLIGGGPQAFVLIMISWLLFVTKLGPNFMKNRNPFVLRKIIMIYNFILVVINAYYIYASLKWLDFGRKSWDPKLPERNQWSHKEIAEYPEKLFYGYSKLFDLFDTVFFVLRKKSNQITFLHVYHHFMGNYFFLYIDMNKAGGKYWEEGVDPRTRGYFLVDMSAITMGTILLTYIFHVVFLIPYLMKNRKPFDLKRVIIAYDVLLVAINGYFWVYALAHFSDLWNFSNPKNDTSDKAMAFINTAHLYYLSKLIDLFDTYFMALKKKNSHISFLHVWHHISVPGAEYLFPLMNGFVHVVMYGYYALAALGPQYQKYLWWKKYITQMQLVQMTMGFVWFNIVWYMQTDLPTGYLACNIGNATALFILFMNFYIQSYRRGDKQIKTQ